MPDFAPTVRLKKGSAKPLHGGHPWVFADAIADVDGSPDAGAEVRVVDSNGQCLGRGFYSPKSAIAVRLLTRADIEITSAFLEARILEALRLRHEILQLGQNGPAPIQPSPERKLNESDAALLASIDQQIQRVQSFAAQYGMNAAEETADLQRRREAILSGKPLPAPPDPLAEFKKDNGPAKTIGPAPLLPSPLVREGAGVRAAVGPSPTRGEGRGENYHCLSLD